MHVFLFVPCFIDQVFPNVAISSMKVLQHLDCDVVFPEHQTCCGQPAYNSGYRDEARLMAMHEVGALLTLNPSHTPATKYDFDFKHDYIVGPSGSCVAMIRNFYPELLADDPRFGQVSQDMAKRTYEFSEFITNVIGADKFSGKLDTTVSYHDSCHALRELGVKDGPRKILERIEGLRLIELPYNDVCCGFGGTFAVKFPEISTAMGDEKLKNFYDTGADILVSGDSSCLMHLEGRARRTGSTKRFIHIAEIMSESIDGKLTE